VTAVQTYGSFTTWLLAESSVASLLGSSDGVYPVEAPPSATLPYIVFQVISDPATYHLGGEAAIRNPLIQVESWASSLLEAVRLGDAIRSALSAYHGVMDNLWVQAAILRDSRHQTSDPADGSQEKRHLVQQDFELLRGS